MNSTSFYARKRFGQHFLRDARIIQQIIRAVTPQRTDHLVEIGPGLGALTTQLLPLVQQLEVVELDRDLLPQLQKNCAALGELVIHQADALRFDFSQLRQDDRPLRLIGNLPYNISTPLIFHLLTQAGGIQDMYFMLQKEVVERMAACSGSKAYGRLSIMVQYYCQVEMLFGVAPTAFSPPPKVESAVVCLRPYRLLPQVASDERLFAEIVRDAFNQRRKVLRNGLKKFLSGEQWQQVNIDPLLRPEQLSIADYVRIANVLAAQKLLAR